MQILSARGAIVRSLMTDVRRYEDCCCMIKVVFSEFARIDILVNNAGVGHIYEPIDCIAPDVWDTTIQTNPSGAFYCCHEIVPIMRNQGNGYIFNISSVASRMLLRGGTAYNASKAGFSGFTETLVKDVRHDGIRVSEIVMGSASTRARGFESWKLDVEDVANLILMLYCLPMRAMVPRVEIQPSQPPPDR